MQQSVSVRRSSHWIWAPLALVLVLALCWSAFWFYSAQRAERDLDAWVAREAQSGRIYTCAGRSIGGYPFRLEVRCERPAVEFREAAGPTTVRAQDLVAVGQIYTPDLVLAEITGPLSVTRAGDPHALLFDWRLMQASVRTAGGRPDRVSIALDGPKVDAGTPETRQALGTAKHAELHARMSPGTDPAHPVLDLATNLQDAVVTLPGFSAQPMSAQGTALLRGLHDLAPRPWGERLREWQAAGGRLEITGLRLSRGDTVALAKGDLGLSGEGRLEGTVNVTATGIEPVAELLLGPTEARTQAAILAGLRLLGGRAELEGKRAVVLPLRFRDGKATLGPVPVGMVPPLF